VLLDFRLRQEVGNGRMIYHCNLAIALHKQQAELMQPDQVRKRKTSHMHLRAMASTIHMISNENDITDQGHAGFALKLCFLTSKSRVKECFKQGRE
jgi:hypothetical protein